MTTQTFVITITDNTITETLTSSPYAVMEYVPNAPDPAVVDALDDSATLTETLRIRIADSSVADNIVEVNSIQTLLDQARKAQTDPSLARVYITFLNATGGTTYRSEIVAGRVEWDEEVLNRAQWVGNVQIFSIYIERRYYWEMSSETQLQLSNQQATATTSAVPIYNPNVAYTAITISFDSGNKKILDSANGLAIFKTGDIVTVVGSTSNDGKYTVATGNVAAYIVTTEAIPLDEIAGDTVTIVGAFDNYVQIAAAQVLGVINAPVRLELTNAAGASITYKDIHIGNSRLNNIANFLFTLEAEDGTGGAETKSATASGGLHNVITTAAGEAELWTYTLTKAMMAASRGAYFLAIARLDAGTIAATIHLRLNIKLSATTIYEGPLVQLTVNEYLQELGIIQIPPYLERFTSPTVLTLSLRGYDSATNDVKLDFIQLMPIDSYRFLRQVGYAIANGDAIEVDELVNPTKCEVYGVDSGSDNYRVWVERGTKLKVQPNTLQRFYFLYDESDNTHKIGRKMTVKAYYRARRLSL